MNLLGLITKIAVISAEMKDTEETALKETVKLVEQAAKDRIGEYHDAVGPVPGWAPLAESTKETRVALGFSEDDPLLREGGLRESITSGTDGLSGYVGSNEDKALFAELGTTTQPPRSFLMGGFYDKADEIKEKIGETIVRVFHK